MCGQGVRLLGERSVTWTFTTGFMGIRTKLTSEYKGDQKGINESACSVCVAIEMDDPPIPFYWVSIHNRWKL